MPETCRRDDCGDEPPLALTTSRPPTPREQKIGLSLKLERIESSISQPVPVPNRCIIIQDLPDEVLQEVFVSTCFDSKAPHDTSTLPHLCSVGRRWRDAATKHCSLWTKIPPLNVEDKDKDYMRRLTAGLKLYLARSGSLPISFQFLGNKNLHGVPENQAQDYNPAREVLALLIRESHRWDNVVMKLPLFGLQTDQLRSMRRVPRLSSLDIFIPTWGEIYPESPGLDVFQNAPNLRRLACDQSHPGGIPYFVKFPLVQLESYKVISWADGGAYRDLLSSPSSRLQRVECITYKFEFLPRSPSTFLPHLAYLKLRSHAFFCDVASHLATLTLPALVHLQVICDTSGDMLMDRMYTSIQTLLFQSGCSLELLSFSSQESNASALKDILARSPNLVELEINFPDKDCISALTLQPASASPVTPHLKTLIFRPQGTWHWNTSKEEGEALVEMLRSRSASLRVAGNNGLKQALREVIFLYSSDTVMLHDLSPTLSDVSFDRDELEEQAWAQDTLDGWWVRHMFLRPLHHRSDSFSPTLIKKFERAIRDMEGIDLEKACVGTHKLMCHGFPTLLRLVNEMEGGVIPGDRLLRFRARAGRLLEKWKPYLLRDARRYRWCRYPGGTMSLKWNGTLDSGRELTEGELWDDVVGVERPTARTYHIMRDWRS